ncbi:S-malonyltransferase Mct1 [Schizosaccharomyces japonicus yFS275]|uniref:[acyl-carrier-protein] S-malonyltransferase n=1 Tax=Schizosaccharomyces japonicus (strain yFS275 / FY16936) TaxID=402676 RepID=B6K5J9_SCHJY|nr:S-malonyltransferase Mct1 [Schizosaccharomyces japonicus yFS275]EEB08803.1 S-malonyltransferase Mct1 [Schizosaccharomyces japonicus yFS275]
MPLILFPGQGIPWTSSVRPFLHLPAVQNTLKHAEQVLSISILNVITDDGCSRTASQLPTSIVQPSVLACSVALYRAHVLSLRELPEKHSLFLGHSLGEYAALVASKALSFEDALRVVDVRGRAMHECAKRYADTGMLCLTLLSRNQKAIGAFHATLQQILETQNASVSIPEARVVVANLNSPLQIVFSGRKTALQAFSGKAIETIQSTRTGSIWRGSRVRSTMLDVEGAFHSPFMEPTEEPLYRALQTVQWNLSQTDKDSHKLRVLCNVTGDFHEANPNILSQRLVQHCTQPVQFQRCFDTARSVLGPDATAFDNGPATVASSLARQNGWTLESERNES